MALISAIDSCVSAVTARLRRPTRQVRKTKSGTRISETTVSSHERTIIATRLLDTVTMFERIEDAVLVTTVWTPPTSLARRDWISPVLVPVKNASGIDCRCA